MFSNLHTSQSLSLSALRGSVAVVWHWDFSTPPWGGGLTPRYFFLYTPDQSELVTPEWGGVKSRTDAQAAQGIS